MVVPLPPAHVVFDVALAVLVLTVLTSVALGAKLTQPDSFADTVMLPVVALGFPDTSFEQLTLLTAPDGAANGIVASDPAASATANTRSACLRPIDIAPF